jgi:hypothetical protein
MVIFGWPFFLPGGDMKTLLLVFLIACSTKPTSYQKEKKNEGYSDGKLEDLRVASFKANSKTKLKKALLYAEFRALEICRKEKLLINIVDSVDKSVKKEVTHGTGTGFGPAFYGGMYPYYSRYSSIGVSATFGGSGTYWNETYTYPRIDVLYTCSETIHRPLITVREVPASEVRHLVKDIRGALQVKKISADSPNRKLQEGDLILKAQGKRIERTHELIRLFTARAPKVSAVVLREGRELSLTLSSKDVTEEVREAEKKIIKKACEDEKNPSPLCT